MPNAQSEGSGVFLCATGQDPALAETLSDRQADDAVRARLGWKYLLGLPVEDPGFDTSVLCEFRARLLAGGAEHRLTAHRLDAPAERRPGLGPPAVCWLRPRIRLEWIERYDHQLDNYRLPRKEAERAARAALIGADGVQLLETVYASEAPGWLRQVPAVETLRHVWLQQYYASEVGPIRWRSSADSPPAHLLINSPYDPEARYGARRDLTWVGYKAHVTRRATLTSGT